MADTTFINNVTLTDADWFNDVNRLQYTIFGDPANAAAAFTAIKQAASDTATGAIEIATQAEVFTGSDATRAVVPARQHFHNSAVKLWGRADTAGGNQGSYGISSFTDQGPGQCKVNTSVTFSGTAVMTPGAIVFTDFPHLVGLSTSNVPQTTTSFTVEVRNLSGVLEDPSIYCVWCFGAIV